MGAPSKTMSGQITRQITRRRSSIRAPWASIFAQASEKFTVHAFRCKVLCELKKIKLAWRSLNRQKPREGPGEGGGAEVTGGQGRGLAGEDPPRRGSEAAGRAGRDFDRWAPSRSGGAKPHGRFLGAPALSSPPGSSSPTVRPGRRALPIRHGPLCATSRRSVTGFRQTVETKRIGKAFRTPPIYYMLGSDPALWPARERREEGVVHA